MKIGNLHPWNVTAKQAIDIQHRLSRQIISNDRLGKIAYIAGVDAGFERDGAITRAAVVILEFPSLALMETSIARLPTNFPYIPGLLSFREIPAILEAMTRLAQEPDLLICDGQGVAHPRRIGIASHLGLLTGLPSIGVGKSRLIGAHDPVRDQTGAWEPLWDKGELIGAVVRTRKGVKPVYVSTGHKISLETAISYVLACTTRFKLPEAIRMAHHYASRVGVSG
jgi:deoxyribonuclease V